MSFHQGKITISRLQGDRMEATPIRIKVTDEDSHAQAISIHLTLENFAEALLGRGFLECGFEFNDCGIIGKVREHKMELVPFTEHDYKKRHEAAQKAMKPLEINGWKGRAEDWLNHNNRRGDFARVCFERYVEKQS